MKKQEILSALLKIKPHSCWTKGVTATAIDLIDAIKDEHQEYNVENIEKALLKGAKDWKEFSYGGGYLIYDGQIAEAFCTPAELRRTKNGQLLPNNREQWIDTQARALYQASKLILNIIK